MFMFYVIVLLWVVIVGGGLFGVLLVWYLVQMQVLVVVMVIELCVELGCGLVYFMIEFMYCINVFVYCMLLDFDYYDDFVDWLCEVVVSGRLLFDDQVDVGCGDLFFWCEVFG